MSDLRSRAQQFAADHAPKAAPPPVDAGTILARAPRTDGTEFRVSLHRYEGKPYVRVGAWQSAAADAWPVKGKVVSVKVRELAALANGIVAAMDAVDAEGGPLR
jgi:hypothetical protein